MDEAQGIYRGEVYQTPGENPGGGLRYERAREA
jgi:hypothetical protein